MAFKDKEKYNEYMRVKILERYHQRRKESYEILGGVCVICGETTELEIDHIDPRTKAFGISKLWSVSRERYLEELSKCQLLCKEHHILKSRLNGDFKGGYNKVETYDHGTGYMYNNDKCKCDLCKEWRKLYRNKKVKYNGDQLI